MKSTILSALFLVLLFNFSLSTHTLLRKAQCRTEGSDCDVNSYMYGGDCCSGLVCRNKYDVNRYANPAKCYNANAQKSGEGEGCSSSHDCRNPYICHDGICRSGSYINQNTQGQQSCIRRYGRGCSLSGYNCCSGTVCRYNQCV